jgi:hypothetical protein
MENDSETYASIAVRLTQPADILPTSDNESILPKSEARRSPLEVEEKYRILR